MSAKTPTRLEREIVDRFKGGETFYRIANDLRLRQGTDEFTSYKTVNDAIRAELKRRNKRSA